MAQPSLAGLPHDRSQWIAAMVADPILIERPILLADDGRAVSGRPRREVVRDLVLVR